MQLHPTAGCGCCPTRRRWTRTATPAAAPGFGLRELNTADFLSRDEVQLNNAQISEYLHDKVVLVTGGGGSIGSELCRQIIRYRPKQRADL